MRIVSALIFIALFATEGIHAQFNFHRVYPVPGRSELAMDMTTTSGGYYTLNAIQNFLGNVSAFNVCKFDPKGEMTWSRDITIEDDLNLFEGARIIELEKDTIAVSILLASDVGLDHDKVIVKLDPQGQIVWTKGLGGFETVQTDTFGLTITPGYGNSITGASTYTLDTEIGLGCFNLDHEGEANWYNRVSVNDSIGFPIFPNIFGSKMVEDSSYLFAGFGIDIVSVAALLVKLDSLGDPLWSKGYIDSLGGLNLALDVDMLGDSSTVLAGLNQNNIAQQINGIVMRVDSVGDLIWSKQIAFGGFGIFTFANNVTETENGEIVVSGESLDAFTGASSTFKLKLNREGELIWGKTYPRAAGLISTVGGLVPIAENGTAYWGTASDGQSLFSQLIVADSLGNAGGMAAPLLEQCAQEVVDTVLFDWPTGQTSYFLTSIADTAIVDYMAESVNRAIGFDIPTVMLQDTAFCPDDPIYIIEDATVEGADSYLWNTEETTPTIEVEEEGNPIVEVTINDMRGCFTLCDTATISVLDSTMVALQIDESTWCENREFVITAFPSGGGGNYDITWSSGELTPQISADVPGTYTVEVIDELCEILATQTVSVDEPDIQPADYILAWNIDRYCETGEIELQLYGGLFSDIKWFDALGNEFADGTNPVVSEFGTYSFTALDTCNFLLEDEITVPENLPAPQEINIDFNVEAACATGALILELNGDVASGLSMVRWMDSAGALLGTNLSVEVPSYGTYTVTAIDACQNEIGDEITISLDNLPTTDIILIADDTISCATGLLRIRIENPTGLSNIMWSSGQTNQTEIFVDEFDLDYSVSADFCQQNYLSNTVSPSINTDNFVRWPNAFYPSFQADVNTDDYNNKSFGPFIICPTAVDNYELRVYNQYGNLMFETNDPTDFWDGTKDGDLAPGDVYVWYSTYEVSTVTEEINGTATLIR